MAEQPLQQVKPPSWCLRHKEHSRNVSVSRAWQVWWLIKCVTVICSFNFYLSHLQILVYHIAQLLLSSGFGKTPHHLQYDNWGNIMKYHHKTPSYPKLFSWGRKHPIMFSGNQNAGWGVRSSSRQGPQCRNAEMDEVKPKNPPMVWQKFNCSTHDSWPEPKSVMTHVNPNQSDPLHLPTLIDIRMPILHSGAALHVRVFCSAWSQRLASQALRSSRSSSSWADC